MGDDEEVDSEFVEQLRGRAEEQDSQLPEEIEVPLGVDEDEAMRAVQQQFSDAGLECTDDEARKLVHAAWAKSEK